jgi:hypothetical protein
MESEGEEGLDEGRRRCRNAFWDGSKGRCFRGGCSLLGPEMDSRGEDERESEVESTRKPQRGVTSRVGVQGYQEVS